MGDLIGKILYLNIDDIVIISDTIEQHYENLRLVFKRLEECNLKLAPSKCQFIKTEIKFLGHIITGSGVHPDPEKTSAIENFPQLKTQRNIKGFLGMVGYYRRFIPSFSIKAAPLTNLLKKNTKFIWTDECEEAFEYFKSILTTSIQILLNLLF